MKRRILPVLILVLFIAGTANEQGVEYSKKDRESSRVSYVMYTDNNGNLYYINTED